MTWYPNGRRREKADQNLLGWMEFVERGKVGLKEEGQKDTEGNWRNLNGSSENTI